MAHSNRKKIRDSRGGKTKHQAAKAAKRTKYRSNFDLDARLKELKADEQARLENKPAENKHTTVQKRTWSNTLSTQRRRIKALDALKMQYDLFKSKKDLNDDQKIQLARQEREINTLMKRLGI